MITKVDARKILEETCGEYVAIDDELVTKVTDGFNEILATQRSPTPRAPAERGGVWNCTHCGNLNGLTLPKCHYCGRPRPSG